MLISNYLLYYSEKKKIDDEFQSIQQFYLNKYWNVFEPIEENKLIYMDIFKNYVSCDKNQISYY